MHSRDSARGWRWLRSLARQLSVHRGAQVRPRLIPPPVVPRVPFSTSAPGVGSSLRGSGIRTAAFMVAYACSHETQRGRKTAERSPSAATVASGAVPPAHEGGHLRSAPIRRSLTVHAERDLPANGYHDPVRDYGHAVHHLGGDAVWGGRWHGGIGTGRSGGLSAGRRRGVRTGRRLATCGPT